ncbi:MAG: hypothetical protein HYV60_19505 [Planctomycetia bacterium]|nr:hypothetical protein [Planctomycetia bacterium]
MSLRAMKLQLAMLDALNTSSNGIGTVCDATTDRDVKFDDGGKWRGPAILELANANLISRVGAANSRRPSRNRGLVCLWKLKDPEGARQTAENLRSIIQRKSSTVAAAERRQLTLLPEEDNDRS